MTCECHIEIEVLVLTYNRVHLIGSTLESLLAQKRPASRICVLDNGSTDGTDKIVRSFEARGIELVRRQTNDARACWSDLIQMARGQWTMLFHDDDLLHPSYLLHVGAAIAEDPITTVAVSSMKAHTHPEQIKWPKVHAGHRLTLTARQLATRLYGGFPMPFCSAVYRTDVLKSVSLQFDIYGKICDRPFVIDTAKKGRAIMMLDSYVKYRVHAQQDSMNQSTGPFLAETFALQRYYRETLGERLINPSGRIFLRRNYRNLMGEYTRLTQRQVIPHNPKSFLRQAIEAGAASTWSLNIGRCYAALTKLPRAIERSFKILCKNLTKPGRR